MKKCAFRAVRRSAFCRSRRELSNAYLLAKFRFDTAENEPSKVCNIERASLKETVGPRAPRAPGAGAGAGARPAKRPSPRASPARRPPRGPRPRGSRAAPRAPRAPPGRAPRCGPQLTSSQNTTRHRNEIWLVLGCIETKFRKKICV